VAGIRTPIADHGDSLQGPARPDGVHHCPMKTLSQLFDNNRAWAERIRQEDPDFFSRLSRQQSPRYLWIGCADSRVPANEIVGLLPGELFVHRNIANLVVHTDLNCLSVLQFAVDILKVRDIIVCGHYGCTGVRAALRRDRIGLSDNWLRHVQDVHQRHQERFMGAGSEAADRLCELNVIEQVSNVCRTPLVRDAWERGQALAVHGWIYGLQDGLLRDLNTTATDAHETGAVYQAALSALPALAG
jgi:carbonic anhydrase